MPQRTANFLLAGLVVFAGWLVAFGEARGQANGATPVINSIFPIAPRELRQHVSRAQTAIAEERFSDAVFELKEVLNNAGSDDFFIGTPGGADAQVSLKSQALALLGSMPLKGRKQYEVECGYEAKQALDAALAAGDLTQLGEVCRRYFHTKAGYEATLLLGRCQLDQGRPLAAALTLKRVAEVPHAAAQYDPELSILLATCWVHANQPEEAKKILVALKQRLPQARFKLVDGEVGLFDRDDNALTWLEGIVGGTRSAFLLAASEWILYRGDEKRNAASGGGVPLLNFNWRVPTVNEPADETRVAQQLRAIRDRGEPVLTALQPLVVQDYAIVRMPDNNKLVGFNLKKQGKREWVYPPGDENPALTAARQSLANSRTQAVNVREQELRQRVFEDQAFGQVSSDGRQVYVIDELGYAPASNSTQVQQMLIIGRGRPVANNNWTKSSNLLVALELATQGKAMWAVGGTTGDNPALAGAFFLGPPLPVGDQLFALAEFNGEIRLLCLDSKSGSLLWKQQLAVLENLDITVDSRRRLAGASPSLGEGILICPTSAGAVIAFDLATRTLRWGYQYGRNDIIMSSSRIIRTNPTTDTGRWIDATATIADGCVILTPVESPQLHCLDLLTGKARWQPQARDDGLFVGCIHQGKIVLIGQKRVRAVSLADGKSAWSGPLDLGGESIVGRGYYSDNYYYLPVTGQQLLKIDLDKGQIVAKAQTEVELGNLVCYKDQLISQSPQTVASFVLHSPALQKQLDERLAANPKDIDALLLQAQILLQEGKANDSLKLLRQAREFAPDRTAVRGLLAKVMLVMLRQDFSANLDLTDELDTLVTDPALRREVLRFRVQGLARTGRRWEALTALLELADQELATATVRPAAAELQSVDRDLSVRADRWLQGQMQALLRGADSDIRERLSQEIKVRKERAIQSGSPSQLRVFLNLFEFEVSAATSVRLSLAEKLIAGDGLLEAELHLGELLSVEGAAGPARALLALLYERARRPELAARKYHELASDFASVVCRDGLTGQQLAQRAAGGALQQAMAQAWPHGKVEVKEADASSNINRLAEFSRSLAYPVPITRYGGAAPRGLRVTYDNSYVVTVRSDLGQTLATSSLRSSDGTIVRRIYSSQNSAVAQACGHLVAVNFGAEIMVLDGLRTERGGDALLWRQDTIETDPNVRQAMIYAQQRTTNNPLLGPRQVSYDPTGRMSFNNGPLSINGFCLQRGRSLLCVDPLTGQSLWERGQIPPQAEIFGDGELIFVADATGEQTLVLSAIDGTLLGKRRIDRGDRRWLTFGRNVLAYEQAGSTIQLRLYDAWKQPDAAASVDAAQGESLWTRTVPPGTRACPIEGELVALLEPSGQFTVVSLADGQVQFAVPLEPESSLAWIQVLSSRDQFILLASQEQQETQGVMIQPLQTNNSLTSRMHGRVYAFRRATGKLQWQSPAFVANHCLPPDQPAESPLLFFVRNRTEAGRGNTRQNASVLVLDRRDGRPVYENDAALPQIANNADVAVEPIKQSVSLMLLGGNTKTYVFQLTDKPMPPQPPAQTGSVASNSVGELPGKPDGAARAAVELLNRGILPAQLVPRAVPAPVPR